ncbi:MAG: hypothetical protein ACE3L7_33350 [Candidatus Pristimantibacillus sp.]
MYLTKKVFSMNCVFRDPVTGAHASLLVHNTSVVIVTDDGKVISSAGNKSDSILRELGYTDKVYNGHGDVQETN